MLNLKSLEKAPNNKIKTSMVPVGADGSVVLKPGMKILGTCVDNGQFFLLVREVVSLEGPQPALDLSRQTNV